MAEDDDVDQRRHRGCQQRTDGRRQQAAVKPAHRIGDIVDPSVVKIGLLQGIVLLIGYFDRCRACAL